MSKKLMEWEDDLNNDIDRKPVSTGVYISYLDDAAKVHKATIIAALSYSRLFFGDIEGAKSGFRKSIELAPDNIKAVFELSILEN